MTRFNFDYDSENDDLFIYRFRKKSKYSIEFSRDIILDFDENNKLVGIELLEATKTLAMLSGKDPEWISKLLKDLKTCQLSYKTGSGKFVFSITLLAKRKIEATTVNLAVPEPELSVAVSRHK